MIEQKTKNHLSKTLKIPKGWSTKNKIVNKAARKVFEVWRLFVRNLAEKKKLTSLCCPCGMVATLYAEY